MLLALNAAQGDKVAAYHRGRGFRALRGLLFPVSVLLVGALLLLCRLDGTYLWQDEAETAIISRHLLTYGVPLSTDGTDWVQQAGQSFVEFTSDYVWVYHSWLQYALTAVAFAVLGPSTLSARLLFALAGLATLLFFYAFVSRWLTDKRIARVATVLLLFCIPFLLLMRQDRYYALAALFTLFTVDAYLRLRSGTPWAVPYFILSGVLLYHSDYGAFFPTLIALSIHLLLSHPERILLHRFLKAGLITAAFVLPWALFMRVWNRGQPFQLDRFLAQLGQYFLYITAWVFPLIMIVLLLIAWIGHSVGGKHALNQVQASFCQMITLVIVTNVAVLSASAAFDWVFFRYMVHLIPLLLIMLGMVVVLIMQRWAPAGYALLFVLVVSNGLHMLPYGLPGVKGLNLALTWPDTSQLGPLQALQEVWLKAGRFRSDAWMYAQELTHSYVGPNEGLVAYLSTHAKPGQTLAVNYEDLPLMFYTKLRVLGGLGAHGLTDDLQPDWVVDRKYGPYRERLAAIVMAGSYERFVLPYPDIRWENRPEPGVHHYLTVRNETPVVIYRRRGQ